MSELKPLVCPQCGGTIDRARYICEYCGTQFERPMYEGAPLSAIKVDGRVDTLVAHTHISNELLAIWGEKIADRYAQMELCNEIARTLEDHVIITSTPNRGTASQEYRAILRVLKPDFRF